MLTPIQQSRLDRRCAAAAAKAIDAFPDLLAQCEAEAAAAIVADLIKAHLARPVPEPNAADALAAIVQMAMNAEDDDAPPPAALSPASPFPRP